MKYSCEMEKPGKVYAECESQGKISFRWRRKGRLEGYLYTYWVWIETSLVLTMGILVDRLKQKIRIPEC